MSAPNYNSVSVGTGATVILASNPERNGFVVANTSAGTVFLGMDTSVTASNGVPVTQNSSVAIGGLGTAYKGAVYGIVVSATSDVRFWEY